MDRKLKISFNSPIILGFVILSFIVYLADNLTGGFSTRLLFSVYRSSFIDPFTYFRFFGHVLGHANLDHFLGNIMLILVIGPMLEEKYGSANILFVILATALVDTGSRMDDVVFEEFKGTGNMEIVLNRKLSEKRIFPAIDVLKSSTRRDDLLLSEREALAVNAMRKATENMRPEDSAEQIIQKFDSTDNNEELVEDVIAHIEE